MNNPSKPIDVRNIAKKVAIETLLKRPECVRKMAKKVVMKTLFPEQT